MLQYPVMSENDIDDSRAKPYEWLDAVYPFEVDSRDVADSRALLATRILEISKTAKELAKFPDWDPLNNLHYRLRVDPDNGSWHFHGISSTFVTRETLRPGEIQKYDDHNWDLGELTTEVVETVQIPDIVTSQALLRMKMSVRRNLLKQKSGMALDDLTRGMDTSFPSEDLERQRDAVRTAYEHVLRGIVHPAFDPEALSGAPARTPQETMAAAPQADYVI